MTLLRVTDNTSQQRVRKVVLLLSGFGRVKTLGRLYPWLLASLIMFSNPESMLGWTWG